MTIESECAVCAKAAYSNEDSLPELTNLIRSYYLDSDNAEGYVFCFPKKIIIALRGTEPSQFSDITADLKFWRVNYKSKEKVHSGFFFEALSLWGQIVDALYKELKLNTNDSREIYVTGHSLGGAMAVIVAGFVQRHTPVDGRLAGLITFGQPRVGNIHFNESIDCEWKRFVNNNDVVPRVPPKMYKVFADGGDLQYINTYGNIRDLTWWQSTKDSYRGRKAAWKKGQMFDSFYDHGMANYVNLVK